MINNMATVEKPWEENCIIYYQCENLQPIKNNLRKWSTITKCGKAFTGSGALPHETWGTGQTGSTVFIKAAESV